MSLTSPAPSSTAPVWIFSPQSHSHCVGPIQPAAVGQYPTLPINTGSDIISMLMTEGPKKKVTYMTAYMK